jgi:hypothetical protein
MPQLDLSDEEMAALVKVCFATQSTVIATLYPRGSKS